MDGEFGVELPPLQPPNKTPAIDASANCMESHSGPLRLPADCGRVQGEGPGIRDRRLESSEVMEGIRTRLYADRNPVTREAFYAAACA